MKSPFSEGNACLIQEEAEIIFRKERFQYVSLFYVCEDSGERFTTTELDEINISQVYNQYRVKYGIPFPDEIHSMRLRYEVSASKMSEILGFGDNQYRLYEHGDIPSEANGKVLSSISDPLVFKAFVENTNNQFEGKEYEKICLKIGRVLASGNDDEHEKLIYESYSRSSVNGYAKQSCRKLRNIVLFFIKNCDAVYNTKMNKLLFYADFLSYKLLGRGISGLAYRAIKYGPVPVRWDRVYSLLEDVSSEIIELPSGNYGIKLCTTANPDENAFSEEEQSILNAVLSTFKDISVSEISKLSHAEDAWIKYHNTDEMIDYSEAFTLRAV